jgi:hypothetical protein
MEDSLDVTEIGSGGPTGQIGVLKRVDLRLIWPREAHDFTAWLAQNLSLLGDALGLDLELRLQEAPVGPFSLDLLAHAIGRDRAVIIENQREPTDHDHLGKLLTYAAGHGAVVAVWIAKEFRDEHRQALDGLNQRTDISTEFFGVVVEALQIDDSRPASNFRLIAFSNDWRKSKFTSGGTSTSLKGEAYRAFVQGLMDRLREEYRFTGARKAQAQSWYFFSSGIKGVSYSIAFAGGSRAQAETCIDREDKVWNKWLFDELYAQHETIEAEFGERLEWERLDNRRASRIANKRPGSIEDSPETLEEIENWAIDRLLRFKRVIRPRVSAIVSASSQLPARSDFMSRS